MNPPTARQLEIARLLDQGLTHSEVADQLGITAHTVKATLRELKWKLGVGKNRLVCPALRSKGLL